MKPKRCRDSGVPLPLRKPHVAWSAGSHTTDGCFYNNSKGLETAPTNGCLDHLRLLGFLRTSRPEEASFSKVRYV